MDFTLHTQFDPALKDAWNALLCESIAHVPFLRYEYLENWWTSRGGGEWPAESQLILVTAHKEGALVGIAPLFFTQHEGSPSLMLLGSIEISDYLNLLVRPDDLPAFTSGLLDFLSSTPQIPAWEKLDLYNILEPSPVLDVLEDEAKKRDWAFQSERIEPSPYLALPGDWDAYLASIEKKQRHEIRRKIRRLENADIESRWYIVKDGASLDSEIDDFFRLMKQDPEKARFLTDTMADAMRKSIHSAFEHGYLQFVFLEIAGEKAAAYLNFDYHNRIWVYNSGFEQNHLTWSPGWVLLGYILQWANDNKRQGFDFMRGNEKYKYRFGAKDRFIRRVTLTKK